ncbi:hypothetical protein JCGZ_15721 [Jatropha curcas]|uniref:Uncharacterized protein n=1 Tax=Jatropha curcas TaxID=180498 RepID=A0A067LB42_JATCU|nr:nuclear transport factor 2 [Jatropha curcas]KDP41314.1 hypothetical protein JCGZ_15721 [Jatropha curcas]
MATQVEESTPNPQVVGNAFVEQYYTLLTRSPKDVHKFYHNSSVISRPDFDGSMSSASTLEGIDKMILSLDYSNCGVEILTTDSQKSFGNGVIVMVTGFFTGKNSIKRKFTQMFFLAPQDSHAAYYVLNDVLRYVDENEAATIEINDVDDTAPAAPVTPDPEPTLVSDHIVLERTASPLEDTPQAEEPSHPSENGKISDADEVVSGHSVDSIPNDGPPVSAGAGQSDACKVSEATVNNVQEDTPKRSYASVANELNYKKQPFQQRIVSAKHVEHLRPTAAPEASPHPVNNKPVEKINNNSVKGHSIFVANLPMNATVEDLIETFQKFGPIKPNGVQVRSYKQEKNCFGFVEFESASSVQSALEASPIRIGEREAHIEEKKANNEGGKYAPRKGGFKGENFRSRGNFSGGRGYQFDNQGGASGQHRGGMARRNGEANQKVYQNGGRVPRQTQTQPQAEAQGVNI